MKICSIDLETTGLDPEGCSILEIAAVAFNTDNPHISTAPCFNKLIVSNFIRGQPHALAMNAEIIKEIASGKGAESKLVVYEFNHWLNRNFGDGKVVVTGKNFASFDLEFLRHSDFNEITKRFHHRVIDPCSMFILPSDVVPPSTEECCWRAGISYGGNHRALQDALQVAELVRIGLSRLDTLPKT